MDDFFRANFANLKGSESKLLFTLRELGLDQVKKSELMRLSGVTDRHTFYRAWSKLEEGGWLRWVQNHTTLEQNPTTAGAKPHQVVQNPTDGMVQNPTTVERNPTSVVQDPTSMDFETALEMADAMDGSGDERQPNSPFQVRRKQQLVLLQEAWAEMFGEELAPLSAKELVQTARSQALDVYHAMQQAKDRNAQYPRAYVKKILVELAKKPAAVQQDESGVLRPATEEQRQSWIDNEKQLAGALADWSL